MTDRGDVELDRARRLMMAALDDEIGVDDRTWLDRVLAKSPELRAEWERLTRLKEVTGTMKFREPPDEVWETYWTGVYNRIERGIGWILFSIGSIVICAFGAWKWIEAILGEADMPMLAKLAIFAIAAGLIILAVSVIRERLFTRKTDPYKEIQR